MSERNNLIDSVANMEAIPACYVCCVSYDGFLSNV